MKKLFIMMCMFVGLTAFAQEATKEAKPTKVEQRGDSTIISYSKTTKADATPVKGAFFDVKGVKYPIYLSKNGKAYIIRTSRKTGEKYNQYLSDEVAATIKK